jgi:hypothetical protein
MSGARIIWEDQALQLLDKRDRYARTVVQEEFRDEPQRNAVELDPGEHTFITPVFEQRFGVVWRLENLYTVVQAVVPLTIDPTADDFRTPEGRQRLKDYVQRAVTAATAQR